MSDLQCDDLCPGNSTTVDLIEVKVDGEPRNDATVIVSVKDSSNNVVTGGNAVAMPSFESGGYRGILPANLGIVAGGRYWVEVTATIAGAGVGFWKIQKTAKNRGRC